MATLSKRGKSWVLQWSENGKQNRKSLGPVALLSKSKATEIMKAKEAELSAGVRLLSGLRSKDSVNVRQYYEKYFMEHYRATRAELSADRLESAFSLYLLEFFGSMLISDVCDSDMQDYVAKRMKAGAHANTIKHELSSIRTLLKSAYAKYGIPSRVTSSHAPKNVESKPPIFYSSGEMERIYDQCNPYWAAVFKFIANTGMRRREVKQLKWENVKEHYIEIVSTRSERTKSGRWRKVPLSPGAKDALAVIKKFTENVEYVMREVDVQTYTIMFKRAVEAAGLKGTLHSLRHSFASAIVQTGSGLQVAQSLLGHKNITTTQIYAHLDEDALMHSTDKVTL